MRKGASVVRVADIVSVVNNEQEPTVLISTRLVQTKEIKMGKLISIGVIIITVILLAILSCIIIVKESPASSPLSHSRYVQMFVDPEYGCQYLTTMDGGITPRKNLEGEHVGCNK